MAPTLFPFDLSTPSQILSKYSEWLYFTLCLVFFISIAGVTLRKHFDRPYVKPLIVSVGLILTVAVFMAKDRIALIIGGWGLLGTTLLALMAAFIPFGLARGFGLPTGRAFFLTYIPFYILSLAKFPQLHQWLASNNLGLISLGLLVLFIVAVWQLVSFRRQGFKSPDNWVRNNSPHRPAIDKEVRLAAGEERVLKHEGIRLTKHDLRTIEDMENALSEVQTVLSRHANNLDRDDRERIAKLLRNVAAGERLFKQDLDRLHKAFQKVWILDHQTITEIKERMKQAKGKHRRLLKAEFDREQEKLNIEDATNDLQSKLDHNLKTFDYVLTEAIDHFRTSPYPASDAKPQITQARQALQQIKTILSVLRDFEQRLLHLAKSEATLLEAERKAA